MYSHKLADAWITLSNSNPMFAGEAPLTYIIRGGVPAMVRRSTTARCPARRTVIPATTYVPQDDTHRLIPSRYSDESVPSPLADNDQQVSELFEVDGATNDRLLGEANLLPGISVHQLLFGVTYAHIVNAAFTHAHPFGSRFNSPERGAWYAGFELETAQAEVAFHKTQELTEINWSEPEEFTFDDYLADFRAEFHDIPV